jgi:hypothetical protein
MESTIPIKDFNADLHELKLVLNVIGFQMNYQQVDLLWRAMELYEIKGKDFSVKDAVDVQIEWSNHWDNYFENKHKHKPKKDKNGRYNNNHTTR